MAVEISSRIDGQVYGSGNYWYLYGYLPGETSPAGVFESTTGFRTVRRFPRGGGAWIIDNTEVLRLGADFSVEQTFSFSDVDKTAVTENALFVSDGTDSSVCYVLTTAGQTSFAVPIPTAEGVKDITAISQLDLAVIRGASGTSCLVSTSGVVGSGTIPADTSFRDFADNVGGNALFSKASTQTQYVISPDGQFASKALPNRWTADTRSWAFRNCLVGYENEASLVHVLSPTGDTLMTYTFPAVVFITVIGHSYDPLQGTAVVTAKLVSGGYAAFVFDTTTGVVVQEWTGSVADGRLRTVYGDFIVLSDSNRIIRASTGAEVWGPADSPYSSAGTIDAAGRIVAEDGAVTSVFSLGPGFNTLLLRESGSADYIAGVGVYPSPGTMARVLTGKDSSDWAAAKYYSFGADGVVSQLTTPTVPAGETRFDGVVAADAYYLLGDAPTPRFWQAFLRSTEIV